jgi:hemerythrin
MGRQLVWSEGFSVGNEFLDLQHRELFNLAGRLEELLSEGEPSSHRDALTLVMQKLTQHTHDHFADEEKVLARFKYPLINEHIKEHRGFAKQVQLANEKVQTEATTPAEIGQLLVAWINHHVMGSDQDYARYYDQHLRSV